MRASIIIVLFLVLLPPVTHAGTGGPLAPASVGIAGANAIESESNLGLTFSVINYGGKCLDYGHRRKMEELQSF